MSKKPATSRTGLWSKKIIASRTKNKSWYKAMVEGRRNALLNPSVISLLRARSKLRQLDVAKTLGLTEPTYSQIERGRRPVKREIANKIAAQLGVQLKKIFAEKDKKFVALIHKQII